MIRSGSVTLQLVQLLLELGVFLLELADAFIAETEVVFELCLLADEVVHFCLFPLAR